VRGRRERGKTGNGFENLIFTPRYILWTGHLRDGCGHAAAVEKGKRRAQRAGRIGKGRRGPSGRWKLSQRPSVELVSRNPGGGLNFSGVNLLKFGSPSFPFVWLSV
jgi:hypothetical protein